jgi:uracil-DNA glycosylase
MQPRVLHMLHGLGLHPHDVPASNVVFVRSNREAALAHEKPELLQQCWPVHDAVIRKLGTTTIVCFGGTAGRWVRDLLAAHRKFGEFIELNARRWTSESHINNAGVCVVTVTHPSIADWRNPATDPTPLVRAALQRS